MVTYYGYAIFHGLKLIPPFSKSSTSKQIKFLEKSKKKKLLLYGTTPFMSCSQSI